MFCGISHLFGNSTSSIVSGRGTPLVSGSNSIKPPPMRVMIPESNNREGENHWQQTYVKTHFFLCRQIPKTPPGFLQNCHQIGAVFPPYGETNIPKTMSGKSFQMSASLYNTNGAMMLPISQKVEQADTPKFLFEKHKHKLRLLRCICGETVASILHLLFLLFLPDIGWEELSVNKNHHLHRHGDCQPTNAAHHSLKPEHT